MTLKIDFDNKTIEVDDSTRLEDIIDALQALELEWREFSVKPAEGTIRVVVERKTLPSFVRLSDPVQPFYPNYPWKYEVTC